MKAPPGGGTPEWPTAGANASPKVTRLCCRLPLATLTHGTRDCESRRPVAVLRYGQTRERVCVMHLFCLLQICGGHFICMFFAHIVCQMCGAHADNQTHAYSHKNASHNNITNKQKPVIAPDFSVGTVVPGPAAPQEALFYSGNAHVATRCERPWRSPSGSRRKDNSSGGPPCRRRDCQLRRRFISPCAGLGMLDQVPLQQTRCAGADRYTTHYYYYAFSIHHTRIWGKPHAHRGQKTRAHHNVTLHINQTKGVVFYLFAHA